MKYKLSQNQWEKLWGHTGYITISARKLHWNIHCKSKYKLSYKEDINNVWGLISGNHSHITMFILQL